MKKSLLHLFLLSLLLIISSCAHREPSTVEFRIIHTTDLHGNVYPYDFINDRPGEGSFARIASYVRSVRESQPNVILLDAGDLLQGQPTAYYYNFIDTISTHLMGAVLNDLGYDALTIGNHDIEPGHAVYDRFVRQLNCPTLGANVIDTSKSEGETLTPYFKPYTIIEKGGKRIAVLGMITPRIPDFLPESIWRGLRFDDIVATAKRVMPEIKAQHPDMVIAMLHSGIGDTDLSHPLKPMAENAGYDLAREVDGIDLILLGHDHQCYIDSVIRSDDSKVYLLNPANDGHRVTDTKVVFNTNSRGETTVTITPTIVSVDSLAPDSVFLGRFKSQFENVKAFVSDSVSVITHSMDSRLSLFGPSPFVDLIHQLQLALFPQSQISLTAPLVFNAQISKGQIYVRDLFNLYKYENLAYLMDLTGAEVKGILELSYDRWISPMKSEDDHLLQMDLDSKFKLKNPFFNYDSAAGIIYTVDVTKSKGGRVNIISMADGTPFGLETHYKVVVNSYRGNGGGELLTKGGGIPHDSLLSRIISSSDKDLRYYLLRYLEAHDPYTPHVSTQWQFVPASLVQQAIKCDARQLFGTDDFINP